MALDYSKLAETALRLISENGIEWELWRETKGAYDPSQLKSPVYSEQIFTVDAVLMEYDSSQIDDRIIITGDKKMMVAPNSTLTVDPMPGDKFINGDESWRVVHVKEFKPAATVLYYEIQVRQ